MLGCHCQCLLCHESSVCPAVTEAAHIRGCLFKKDLTRWCARKCRCSRRGNLIAACHYLLGNYRENRGGVILGVQRIRASNRQRSRAAAKRNQLQGKKDLHSEFGWALQQVSQGDSGISILWDFQNWTKQSHEQTSLTLEFSLVWVGVRCSFQITFFLILTENCSQTNICYDF